MLRAMIVEDVKEDAKLLKGTLEQLEKDVDLYLFPDGAGAIRFLKKGKEPIHLFFIDRGLPDMNGFTLAEKIREMEPYLLTPIVFVTGYEMDQLEAFQEYHCYSYIVKPFTKESVEASIGRLLQRMNRPSFFQGKLKKVLYMATADGLKLIYAKDVFGIETIGRDICVYSRSGRIILPGKTMKRVLAEFDEDGYVQCHKSFAVNVAHITGFAKVRRYIWKPIFDEPIPFECEISKTYYEKVVQKYERYMREKE